MQWVTSAPLWLSPFTVCTSTSITVLYSVPSRHEVIPQRVVRAVPLWALDYQTQGLLSHACALVTSPSLTEEVITISAPQLFNVPTKRLELNEEFLGNARSFPGLSWVPTYTYLPRPKTLCRIRMFWKPPACDRALTNRDYVMKHYFIYVFIKVFTILFKILVTLVSDI